MMNEVCLRCLAHVHIRKISWKFDEHRQLCLKGPPVFVKISLLGQTQSSPLFQPVFPLSVNYSVTFDRIFTNCKLQSFLPELLRSEMVRLELIQLKDDYTGGKILARFESSSYSFLFPERIEQVLEMNKSRSYKYPPGIELRTNVTVSDTYVRSPVSIIKVATEVKHDPAFRLQRVIHSTQDKLKAVSNGPNSFRKVSFIDKSSLCFDDRTNEEVKVMTSTPTHQPKNSTAVSSRKPSPSRHLVDKYLVQSPISPSLNQTMTENRYQIVQSKVDKVLEKYWDSKIETEEISYSSDEENIKHSFATEREASLNKTTQSLPQDSLLVRIGPTDYWSKQLAEYKNESHREVFSETMEKIYNRLYHGSL